MEYDWHAAAKKYEEYGSLKDLETYIERMKIIEKGSGDQRQSSAKLSPVNLSEEQQEVVDLIE